MKVKSWIKLAVIVVVIALVACLALNGLHFNDYIKKSRLSKYIIMPVGEVMSLGLDLEGGSAAVFAADAADSDALLDETVAILRTRFENAGYEGATVARYGDSSVRIEIPGVSHAHEIIDILAKPARLEFRDPSGNVIFDGSSVKKSYLTQNPSTMMYQVAFELDKEGTKAFKEATTTLRGQTLSIYLDDEQISASTVSKVISDGKGVIPYNTTTQSESWARAQELALFLESGALPIALTETEVRATAATLGTEAISGMVLAGGIALAAIMLLLIIRYRLPGVAASLALLVYALVVLYVLAIIQARLTLSGIAGILLGLFIAAGAFVLIIERFRDEVKAGRPLLNAHKLGFKSAFRPILDITVAASVFAAALLLVGPDAVRSFATALIVSALTTFVVASVVMRGILKIMIGLGFKADRLYT